MRLSRNAKLSIGMGIFLALLGLFLMYDSGFLLNLSGNVVCNGPCYYYEYVYPIKKAEFWIGLGSIVIGLFSLGIGTLFGIFRHQKLNAFAELEKSPKK